MSKYRLVKNGLGKYWIEKYRTEIVSNSPGWYYWSMVRNEREGIKLLDAFIEDDIAFERRIKLESLVTIIKEV